MQLTCAAVLFDLDGVLVDSRTVIRRHWTRWAHQRGLDIEEVLAVAHGRRPADTVRLLLPESEDPETLATDIVQGEASDAEGMLRLPGALELIQSLPLGKWTVATSGPRAIAQFRLKFAGIPWLPTHITAEDVVHGKPDPEPYLAAAARLQVPAQKCVVIEDAPPGVKAGVAAGCQVIGLATTHPVSDLLAAGAHVITEHLGCIRASVNAVQSEIKLLIAPSLTDCSLSD
jgi:sugar-phosphatase